MALPEIDAIEPRFASLVFPTYYMNNPASMFGRTLLAINTDYYSKRLADAVNYTARVDNVNGLSFAISGVFGLYKGYYSDERGGVTCGVIKAPASFWQSHLFGEAMWFVAGDDHQAYSTG
ncbi:MAG: DUF4105 domain-containing protein, partial [Desulfosudaceae bacterium]